MNNDFMSAARAGRLVALAALDRRQPELPGLLAPQEPRASQLDDPQGAFKWSSCRPALLQRSA